MKVKYHIPTEQYGFVEIVKDWNGSELDALNQYTEIRHSEIVGEGLENKDFNRIIDKMLTKSNTEITSEAYELMNVEQQMIIQTLKRAFKRIK